MKGNDNKTETNNANFADVIKQAGKDWPSTLVARQKIEKFTGGVFTRRTMANADYLGHGPDGAFRVGRSVVYPVDSLCVWLIERATSL